MPITIVKCGKCHMTRESYEAAEACEESHLKVSSARELEYQLGAYPSKVMLEFPDGKGKVYILEEGYRPAGR